MVLAGNFILVYFMFGGEMTLVAGWWWRDNLTWWRGGWWRGNLWWRDGWCRVFLVAR